MTWIKICGITNLDDALTAVAAGADALGFVFYEKSPRYVKPQTVGEIVKRLPAHIERVGVFVDDAAERVKEIVEQAGLTGAQIYGKERVSSFVAHLQSEKKTDHWPKVIFSISGHKLAEGTFFISEELRDALYAAHIDSISDAQPGGTGRIFDWQRARATVELLGLTLPIIVAGGLAPDNVGDALRVFRPWGVDVSSGVESRPGKKDPEKIEAFVAAVRRESKP